MSKIINAILVFVAISLSSCSISGNGGTLPPRESFIFIENHTTVVVCNVDEKRCSPQHRWGSASGAIIHKNKAKNKSYILTAEHVCVSHLKSDLPTIIMNQELDLVGLTLNGKSHKGKVIGVNEKDDLCIIETEWVSNPVSKISKKDPKPGDKVFNLAAPRGVWGEDMVLLFEGRFSGYKGGDALYALPAAPGSSGSPIYNKHGQIIGVLHSVNRYFDNVSYASSIESIRKFVDKYVPK